MAPDSEESDGRPWPDAAWGTFAWDTRQHHRHAGSTEEEGGRRPRAQALCCPRRAPKPGRLSTGPSSSKHPSPWGTPQTRPRVPRECWPRPCPEPRPRRLPRACCDGRRGRALLRRGRDSFPQEPLLPWRRAEAFGSRSCCPRVVVLSLRKTNGGERLLWWIKTL